MEVSLKQNNGYVDVINLILAVWLFLLPWLVGFTGVMAAAWTAWLSAIAVGIFGIAALAAFVEWEEWINLILGLWVLVSPWVIGVSGQTATTSVLFVTGLAVAAIATMELWSLHRTPPRAAIR